MTSHLRRHLFQAIAAASLLMLSACRVDTDVDVTVDRDGSGMVVVTITADDDAVDAVPELSSGLELDDIQEAGWTSSGVQHRADGGIIIETSKKFDSADQLQLILDELAGPGVIFSDVTLRQSHSFALTEWDFSASINPAPPLEAFSDPGLAAALDGHFFGRPINEPQTGTSTSEYFFGLDFSLTLPANITTYENSGDGTTASEATDEAVTSSRTVGSTVNWEFTYNDKPVTIAASAAIERSTPWLWLNISRIAAVAFGLVLIAVITICVATAIRTPKGRSRRATRRRKQRAATRAAEASKPPKRRLRLLVVDAHGVLVRPTEPLEGLMPVIRSELPDIDPSLVSDRYHNLILGRLTPSEFWSDLGLGPVEMQVETRYLSSYRLVPGLHDFLDSAATHKLPVVVVANQPQHWGIRLRRMAQIEDLTALWLTSSEVGAVLPNPPLLEAVRRKMSADVHDCLYLSSVPQFLDAAEELGMSTAYFAASPSDMLEVSHPVVRGFPDILRSRSISNDRGVPKLERHTSGDSAHRPRR